MPRNDYQQEMESFKTKLMQDIINKQLFNIEPVPIAYTEVKDYIGKCFHLENLEVATLDQQYKGLIC